MRPGVVTLAFHPPVQTKGLTEKDRLNLMTQVRACMQAAIDADPH